MARGCWLGCFVEGCRAGRDMFPGYVSRDISPGLFSLGVVFPGPVFWCRAQARYRAISTGQLHGLLRFHLRPIDVVVYHGSRRDLVLR